MTLKRYTSVWNAIEASPEETQSMKLRATLMMALQEHISRTKLSQVQAAKLCGVNQPCISNLMRGKIHLFALDTLVNMAAAAGLRVEMRLRKAV